MSLFIRLYKEWMSACASRVDCVYAILRLSVCVFIHSPIQRVEHVCVQMPARINSQACICVCLRVLRAKSVSACICACRVSDMFLHLSTELYRLVSIES